MGVLDGIRVLDLSRFVAGPYCAMLLADMGAEVVKIERPGEGERTRAIEPGVDGQSFYCFVVNRNKQGLTLDYTRPAGMEILHELIRQADVLVENFRPGVMEALGCGWDVVHRLNPRLVMVRISGFGQDGPMAHRQCFDAVAQAESGIMDLTGQPDGPPTMAGTTIIDYTTGMYAAMGALAALFERSRSGVGQMVDVSLLDSATSLLLSALPERAMANLPLPRRGNRDRFSAPSNTFLSADDRWVLINCTDDAMFVRLAALMGQPELPNDPRFADRPARVAHRDEIEGIVAQWCRRQPADAIIAALTEISIPCAKVATIDEVLTNPQLRHRRQVVEVQHQSGARVPMQGVTIQLSRTPLTIRSALPYVGEHTDQVLRAWLGYSEARLAELRQAGTI